MLSAVSSIAQQPTLSKILRTHAVIVLLAVALLTPTAAAQSAASIEKETDPVALFTLGRELYKQGKLQDSYRAYKKSYRIKRGYDVAANLGNVELKLDKHSDAAVHLVFALQNLPPSLENRKKKVATIERLLKKALAHTALYRVIVTPDNATVRVNGTPVDSSPLAEHIGLTPGNHSLTVERKGFHAITQKIAATKGTRETIRIALVALDKTATKPVSIPTKPDTATSKASMPLLIAGFALGGAAVVAGGVMLGLSASKASSREDMLASLGDNSACARPTPPADCSAIADSADAETTLSTAGTTMLIGGGVIAAATAAYALWPRSTASPKTGMQVQPLPILSPTSGGLLLRVRF